MCRLQRPDGQTGKLPPHAEGDYGVWTYDDTTQSGIYTATLGFASLAQQSFAVNVDTRQSDLAAIGRGRPQKRSLAGRSLSLSNEPARALTPLCRPGGSPPRCTSVCCMRFLDCYSLKSFWPGDSAITHHERYLPIWLEHWLGVNAGPGEGMVWRLECHWPWPPWVTLLAAILAVVIVAAIYRRESRQASGRYRAALAVMRLASIALVL